jgi:hypothetical protein
MQKHLIVLPHDCGERNSLMQRKIALGLALTAALCDCSALGQPMTPEEFRQAASSSSLATVESFDAGRPYQQVVDTLRAKANECLDVAMSSSGAVFQGNMTVTEHSQAVYKPTVSVTERGMELAVQVNFGSHTLVQKTPPGGLYILVVDATATGEKATKLTIYRGNLAKAKQIGGAIRAWATGEKSTCPDLNT